MKVAVVAYILNTKSGTRAPIELAYTLGKIHEVLFFALSGNADAATLSYMQIQGIQVTLLPIFNMSVVGNFLSAFYLYTLLKKHKPEVISFHSTLMHLIAVKLTGIPIISTYYGTQWNVLGEHFFPGSLLTILTDKILNVVIYLKSFMLVWLPDQIVAISRFTAHEANNLYRRKIPYVYLGVGNQFINDSPHKKGKSITLLSVSRITPYKQFEVIIRVCNRLIVTYPDLKLIIAGSNPMPTYINYLKSISSKNVTIMTDISDSKLRELYGRADIYVSADKYLFLGLPILEAAAFGLPTIVFRKAAAEEVVSNGISGYTVETELELFEKLTSLIRSTRQRKKFSKNAKVMAREFDWKKTVNQLHVYFKRAKRLS